MSDKETLFYGVFDMTEDARCSNSTIRDSEPVSRFPDFSSAREYARHLSTHRVGNTIVVFEIKEAFRSKTVPEMVWLRWPDEPKPLPEVDQTEEEATPIF